MRAILLLIFSILFFPNQYSLAQSPTFEWVKTAIGSVSNDQGNSISVDNNGNVYVVGHFEGTVDFDPGAGVHELTSNGDLDIFIQKLDASGNLIWVHQIGDINEDAGTASIIDPSGHIYLAGHFEGTVDFDPNTGVQELSSGSDVNIFVCKMDLDGNFVWAVRAKADLVNDIALNSSGDIYTTGQFYGTGDFDPGNGTYTFNSMSGYDAFVHKIDSDGNTLWAGHIGSTGWTEGRGVAVSDNDEVYVTGKFGGTADLDPGPGTFTALTNGSTDAFTLKLNSSNGLEWVKQVGGSGNDQGRAIGVDANGDVYTAFMFRTLSVDFDPNAGSAILASNGAYDIAIQKLNSNGDFLWVRQMGGTSEDFVESMVVDSDGSVYSTGFFKESGDYDPGVGQHYLISNGSEDLFFHKLDSNGDFVWAESVGGTGGAEDWSKSIFVDDLNIYLTGFFTGTADYDPGPNSEFVTPSPLGYQEVFVLKLNRSPSTNTIFTIESDERINAYPNPTSRDLSVDLGSVYSKVEVSVYNSVGQHMYDLEAFDASSLELSLDVRPGVYWLHIQTEEGRSARTRVVIK